jgi:glycosyltransferase involved in cell wall biosynthesis
VEILTLTPLFPSAVHPAEGVFIKERQKHLPPPAHVTVARFRPWFPGAKFLRGQATGAYPPVETVDGLVVHDTRFFYVPRFLKGTDGDFLSRRLERWLRRRGRFDLLDAHFLYPAGYAAVKAGGRLGIPAVVTERGTAASYRDPGRRRKMKWALDHAARVITVSESLASTCREIAGRDLEVRVIPNGVDAAVFAPGDAEASRRAIGASGRWPVLLTVGGLVPRKGVTRVLEVLPRLLPDYPELLYIVVGGSSIEGDDGVRIRRTITELRLDRSVRVAGEMEHARLPDFYRAADLFVLATSNEGWANVLQESLACGTPVVTTDVGGNRELVGGDAHGLIVPFGDAPALERALREALARHPDRASIARYGARRDWSVVGREVMAVYEEALRPGRRPSA